MGESCGILNVTSHHICCESSFDLLEKIFRACILRLILQYRSLPETLVDIPASCTITRHKLDHALRRRMGPGHLTTL